MAVSVVSFSFSRAAQPEAQGHSSSSTILAFWQVPFIWCEFLTPVLTGIPLVFRTLLSILANRNNAVKWIVFILPLIPNSTSIFSKTFVTFQVHKLQQVSSSPSSSVDFYFRLVGWLVRFYDTSTFVGYLMPNSFYTNNQFYFKLFNLAWAHSLTLKNHSISRYSI